MDSLRGWETFCPMPSNEEGELVVMRNPWGKCKERTSTLFAAVIILGLLAACASESERSNAKPTDHSDRPVPERSEAAAGPSWADRAPTVLEMLTIDDAVQIALESNREREGIAGY